MCLFGWCDQTTTALKPFLLIRTAGYRGAVLGCIETPVVWKWPSNVVPSTGPSGLLLKATRYVSFSGITWSPNPGLLVN